MFSFHRLECAFLVFVLLFSGVPAAAQFEDFEFLECGSVVTFEKANGFSIADETGNGVIWSDLNGCGQAANYTGGSGEPLCATAAAPTSPFDTTVETNTFSLKGVSSAFAKFKMNYQDYISTVGLNDRVEIQVQSSAGSWGNAAAYVSDVGTFHGTGVEVMVNLAPWVGDTDVQLRFRYFDSSAGPDSGYYVQIDDLGIECTGGVDMEVSTSNDSSGAVLEGETVHFTYTSKNGGPTSATQVALLADLPSGFIPVSYSTSTVLLGAIQGFSENTAIFQLTSTLNSSDEVSVDVEAVAGLYPEVVLEVLSPSAIKGIYEAGGATFGPAFPFSSPLTGTVILADDGSGNVNDGCQALINSASVSGNIVLLDRSSDCKTDEKILNAQKAGAIAAIVSDGDNANLLGQLFVSDMAILPSGKVTEPVTIPSVRIGREDGELFKANIVSGISIALQSLEVLSQEQGYLSYTAAEQVDPDFSLSKLFLNQELVSNNIIAGKITVLKDTDTDGTPDIEDTCRFDPTKVLPGDCGCGLTETDLDANGISDCLRLDETLFTLKELRTAVKKLRTLKKGSPKKKRKIALRRRKTAKALLESFQFKYSLAGAEISAAVTNSNVNIESLQKQVGKKVKKALKISSGAFRKNKNKASRSISKFLGLF